MKDFEVKDRITPTTELVSPTNQKKEKKYLGSVKFHKGLIVFEVNVQTLEILPAQVNEVPVVGKNGAISNRHIVITKPGCVYVQAINKANALRKAQKHIKKHFAISHAQ